MRLCCPIISLIQPTAGFLFAAITDKGSLVNQGAVIILWSEVFANMVAPGTGLTEPFAGRTGRVTDVFLFAVSSENTLVTESIEIQIVFGMRLHDPMLFNLI